MQYYSTVRWCHNHGPAHAAGIFNTDYDSIAEYESESDSMDNLAFSEMIEKRQTHECIVLIRSKISFARELHFNTTFPEKKLPRTLTNYKTVKLLVTTVWKPPL